MSLYGNARLHIHVLVQLSMSEAELQFYHHLHPSISKLIWESHPKTLMETQHLGATKQLEKIISEMGYCT